MCVPIQRVHRDSAGVITHVGGSTWGGVPWGLTVAEAVELQESSMYSFFVEIPAGQKVDVLVKTSTAKKKYLTTSPDGVVANNLDSLPDMPNPLAGVEPPFPLSIPGPLTVGLMSITSISYSGSNKLTSLWTAPLKPTDPSLVYEINSPSSMWSRVKPRWFHLKAIVPFPAEYQVFQNFGLILERVPGDDPVRRRALEDAGDGWWSLDLVLTMPDEKTIDPTKPSRLTEIKVVICPSLQSWRNGNFTFGLFASSINPYCPGNGSRVSFRLKKPPFVPLVQPPTTTTMPSVVGQHLDKALITLSGLGLTRIFTWGPSGMAADKKVDSQDPVPSTVVKLTDTVSLKTSLGVAKTGVKKIVVTNQSNRAKPMDLWLFDYSTGTWTKKVSVVYQGQTDVVLTSGHTFMLAAVDPTMLNCHTGRPDEGPCVYQSTAGSFVGDSTGLIVTWQIT